MAATTNGLVPTLHVDGPLPELAAELALFGQFVGSWDLRWTGTDQQGAPAVMRGELHFGWVLGGRAVQDTWIVPGRDEPGAGEPPLAFHGSTIRFVGRPVGDTIELISDEDDPQLRWSFRDITATAFTWNGEVSADGGRTWRLEEQMFATRADG